MAIMYPPRLPESTLSDRKLKGEINTYDALSKLSDEFEIFYNRCVNLSQGSKAHKRRIDFIVLHEKLGLLAIEVKGGKIRIGQDGSVEQYHPSTKQWASINPYEQVEKATIELIRDCKANGANHWIPDDTCVIFANTIRRDITDTPNILPNGTLCADDLPIIVTQISTLFSKSARESAWSRDAFLDIRRRLQNMPEAKRGSIEPSGQKAFKKRFYKSLPKIVAGAKDVRRATNNPSVELDQEEYYETEYVEEVVATTPAIHCQPGNYSGISGISSLSRAQSVKLKGWQIVGGIIIGILASLVYVWFLPNSFLHRFL